MKTAPLVPSATATGGMVIMIFVAVWGCEAPPDRPTSSVTVNVSALGLGPVGDVVWDLRVDNDRGEPVWTRRVSASRSGDGVGSLSYVGPCDATDSVVETPDLLARNSVQLWVVGLFAGPLPAIDLGTFGGPPPAGSLPFSSPTPPLLVDGVWSGWGQPLTRFVSCRPNADTPVSFDVTLARPASQGFFDIAVTFNDIFCAAKYDCRAAPLLHDATGRRGPTHVFGFACSAGDGATTSTSLHLSSIALDCGSDGDELTFTPDFVFSPDTGALGNQCVPGPDGMSACAPRVLSQGPLDPDDYFYQYAIYRGLEPLVEDGTSTHSRFWNLAFGLRPSASTCRLRAFGTADDASDPDDGLVDGVISPGVIYPFVSWDIDLDTCESEALGASDMVQTRYHPTPTFAHHFVGDCPPDMQSTPDGCEPRVICQPGTLSVSDGVLTVCAPAAADPRTAIVIPYAATRPPSGLFHVTVDDGVTVHELPVEERMNTAHVKFAFTGAVEVSVTYLEPHILDIGDLVVRPRRWGVPYDITSDGLTVTFTLDAPRKLAIEGENFIPASSPLAGPTQAPWGKPVLFVFADALETDPLDPYAPGVVRAEGPDIDPTGNTDSFLAVNALANNLAAGQTLFFGPGTYLINGVDTKAGRNIYVHGSARLRARQRNFAAGLNMLIPRGQNRFYGRGTIDARGIEYKYAPEDFNIPNAQTSHTRLIRGERVDDVHVDGLIMVDPSAFAIWVEDSERWSFQNVKILEYGKWDAWAPREDDPTRWATWPSHAWEGRGMDGEDGINLDGTRRVTLSDSLIFSADSTFIARHTATNRFVGPDGWALIDDITARNSVLYNHGGGSSGSLGYWRGSVLFRDITFENIAAPEAFSTLFLRSRIDARARIEHATWRGIDYEQSRERGRFGHVEPGTQNNLSSSSRRVYLKFVLPGPGTYDRVLLELPRGQHGDTGATINIHEASNLQVDGTTPWTERGSNGLTWTNQPGPGALIATRTHGQFVSPALRDPNNGNLSFRISGAAITSYVQAASDTGTVSFALTVTPNPTTGAVGNWWFANDEGVYGPHLKIALRVRVDGGEDQWLYPRHDTVTYPTAGDEVVLQATITELDVVDAEVRDVVLAGAGMNLHNLDGLTQVLFDDVFYNGIRRQNPGSVGAQTFAARTPMELSFSSVPDSVIEVVALDPVAVEGTTDTGAFSLVRSGDTTGTTVVYVKVGGAAKSGVDVTPIPDIFTLAPGESSITIPIIAIADALTEPVESVVIEVINIHRSEALARGEAPYSVGPRYVAQVAVLDPVRLSATDFVRLAPDSPTLVYPSQPVLEVGGAAIALTRFALPPLPSLGVVRHARIEVPITVVSLAAADLFVTPVAESSGTQAAWTPSELDLDDVHTLPTDLAPAIGGAFPADLVQDPANPGGVMWVLRGAALDEHLDAAARTPARLASLRISTPNGVVRLGAPRLVFDIVDR